MAADNEAQVDILLENAGERPVGIVNAIRKWTNLNVKQARKLVDSAPEPIITGLSRTQAEAIKVELESLGATISLRASA